MNTLLMAMVGLWLAGLGPASAAPDRSSPPPVEPPVPLDLPMPEVHALGPGATAWYVPVPQVRKVAIHMVVDGGMVELQGRPTETARAMGALLEVAGGARGARRLALDSDLHEIELTSQIGMHQAIVSAVAPRSELPLALDMLRDVVHRPRFPGSALRRHRSDVKLFHTVEAPASLALTAKLGLALAWFGADHPYGTRRRLDLLSTVQRGDLRGAWARLRSSRPVVVLVVGDVPWAQVEEPLTEIFGSLGAPLEGARGLAVVPPKPRVLAVPMPGQEQVAVRLRMAAPPLEHPDHVPMWSTEWALGGHFLSRLNRVLREEKDYTYGASSAYQCGPGWGTFTVSVDVDAENLVDTVTVIRDQLRGMAEQGLTGDEIRGAHRAALLDWNTTLQSAENASERYLEAIEHHWRLTQMLDRVSRLALLEPADGARVASAWLGADESRVWVVVGDRSRVEPSLEILGMSAEWITPERAVLGEF